MTQTTTSLLPVLTSQAEGGIDLLDTPKITVAEVRVVGVDVVDVEEVCRIRRTLHGHSSSVRAWSASRLLGTRQCDEVDAGTGADFLYVLDVLQGWRSQPVR